MRSSLYSLRAFQVGLAAARILPRHAGQVIAPAIGCAIYSRNRQVRDALRSNLRAVTELSGAALDLLCARNVVQFSRMLADYFYCAARAPRQAVGLVSKWHGFEHLEAARSRGKGTIIVTAHLGNWELGGIMLTMRGLPMTVITLDEPSTALTAWRDNYRQRAGIRTIAVGPGREFAFVEMIQTLRRNECVAMLVDRPYAGTGLPVGLFGRETEFSSAPALLWQHTGAAVVPAFVTRQRNGTYLSFAEPIVEMQKTTDSRMDLRSNTQAVAAVFESIIRRHPEQWFNYVPIWKSPSRVESSQPS